jgi:hypothetical protein
VSHGMDMYSMVGEMYWAGDQHLPKVEPDRGHVGGRSENHAGLTDAPTPPLRYSAHHRLLSEGSTVRSLS